MFEALGPKLSKFCPHKPFAKQIAFLMSPKEEVLFGGALGSGKSDVLLMDPLQYVHIPNFSAIIFRRTITDHQLPGGPLHRFNEWLTEGGYLQSKEVKFNGKYNSFEFKTYDPRTGKQNGTSSVMFGYIGNGDAKTRYQGAEFNLVAFDEVTQHKKKDYEYMFTRIRKCVCPNHTDRDENGNPIYHNDCLDCQNARSVPTKMRGTCNPDGVGFQWVKDRWSISPDITRDEEEQTGRKAIWRGMHPDRMFIPATFRDNPHLDHKSYMERLRKQITDDGLFEAMVNGSWGVVKGSKFKTRWKRLYCRHSKFIKLAPDFSANGKILDTENCFEKIFITVDTATTAEQLPNAEDIFPTKVKKECHTVISVWGFTTCGNLLWLDMSRNRIEIPEVVREVQRLYHQWNPSTVVVEENGVGKGVSQYCARMGMNVTGITKTNDKVENATNAIIQMEKGRIYMPSGSLTWCNEIDNEVFSWQGHPDEQDDIVDTLAHAANFVDWTSSAQPEDYFNQAVNTNQIISVPRAVFSKHRFS